MRLFVGIELPEEILEELLKVQKQLCNQAKCGRFVARENLHLTLQFLGEVPTQKIDPIVPVLRKTSQYHIPFSLELKCVGSFENGNPWRVIWVGIDGDKRQLTCLQRDISGALTQLGFPQETRPWQPHITLGRDVEFLEKVSLEKYSGIMSKLSFPVCGFSLIESSVENGKRIYRSLYLLPLGSSN